MDVPLLALGASSGGDTWDEFFADVYNGGIFDPPWFGEELCI